MIIEFIGDIFDLLLSKGQEYLECLQFSFEGGRSTVERLPSFIVEIVSTSVGHWIK